MSPDEAVIFLNKYGIHVTDSKRDGQWPWIRDDNFPLEHVDDWESFREETLAFPYWPNHEQPLLEEIHTMCHQWDSTPYEYQLDLHQTREWWNDISKIVYDGTEMVTLPCRSMLRGGIISMQEWSVGLYSISRWDPKREFDSVTNFRIELRQLARFYLHNSLDDDQKELIGELLIKIRDELRRTPPRKMQYYESWRPVYQRCSIL